ncbi:MAG: hypothetical protein IT494_08560 [Gammaproteobacteria bacterium]|nr:hypothetical protein [Gammaproteobacteria bacterium]
MKLELADPDNHAISGYGAGFISVAGRQITAACLVMRAQLLVGGWPDSLHDLATEHLDRCLELQPEIVLFGTGARQQILDSSRLAPLLNAGVGYEFMSTPAACRCYNILLAEGRRVAALLFLP